MGKKIVYIMSSVPQLDKLMGRFDNMDDYFKYFTREIGGVDYLDIDEPIGKVFFYHGDFSHIQGIELLKRTKEFEFECWRPYSKITKVYSKNVGGIIHKIFPQDTKKDIFGRMTYYSESLERELLTEINQNNILVTHGYPSFFMTKLWMRIKPINIPIIAIHRGSKLLNFAMDEVSGYKKLIVYLKHRFELKVLRKYVDYYQDTIQIQIDYLRKKKINYLYFFPEGIDFEKYQPVEHSNEIRTKLGLPLDKKIILYVGNFTRTKDIDFLIDVYLELKEIRNDILLACVGGYTYDEFYKKGLDSGALMIERLPQEKLLEYHQISNVYVLPTRNYAVKNFAGIGSAVIQSLACGVPVISDNLMHFEGGNTEISKVGMLLENKEKLISNINYILDNPRSFSECRDYARKYYDADICINKSIYYYNLLFKKYYGI